MNKISNSNSVNKVWNKGPNWPFANIFIRVPEKDLAYIETQTVDSAMAKRTRFFDVLFAVKKSYNENK